GDQSHIFFSHSSDAGKTFRAPVRISDVPGDAVDSDGTVEGAMPAVGVNGDVYVVWAGPSGLVFDRSRDGGWTFGDDKVIMATPGGWDIDIAGLSRHNGMPVTRVDYSGGPNHGSVYVNWIDERHGDPDVFIMASRDAGETWTGAVRVNTDAFGNKVEQMFTWLAIDPVDGSVNVIFYDRDGLKGTLTRVLLARSVDGGRTFVNHAIALPAFSSNEEIFFGDYSGIDAFGGLVAPVFMHFVDSIETAVSVALFKFEPNTQIPLTP
ncbi:MAG TPA: glycosyl hydrolase, partial [Acidobacteria bacterium]|nr:glycosyl hydrolase [Acidobacteriota bacterium]